MPPRTRVLGEEGIVTTPVGSTGSDKLTVLAIDDDEVDLQTIRRYLSKIEGFEHDLVECGDAENARKILAVRPIDVVLLDFRLGADNGLELLKTIRTSGATVPVIFLTGQGNEQIAREVARAGGDDYLTKKELTPEILGAAIHRVVESLSADQEQLGFDQMLHRMATEDHVTGLLKQHAFLAVLRQECARTERYDRPLTLMVVDIDSFAAVNTARGQDVGDQVLANIAVILRGILRTTDHFCRYEGDRFAVALTESNPAMALAAGERVCAYVRDREFPAGGGEPVRVTCSVSLVSIGSHDANADRAIIDAVAALAAAKQAGGDRVISAPTA
jgi:two-component system cell cycle response regulator